MNTAPSVDIVIQGEDFKSKAWKRQLRIDYQLNVCLAEKGRPLLKCVMAEVFKVQRRGKRLVVVFRYLNDVSSRWGTIKNAIYELATIGAVVLSGGRLIWICHNIDRETRTYYPLINAFRRWVVRTVASRILATDPLLVASLPKFLGGNAGKFSWTTLGSKFSTSFGGHDSTVEHRIRKFGESIKSRAADEVKIPLIGLCVGQYGSKYLHFSYAQKLMDRAYNDGFVVGLILGGDQLEAAPQSQRLVIERLRNDDRILYIDGYQELDERRVARYFDFFWRSCDDQSVSQTLYTAAEVSRPVLAMRVGFVGTAVDCYNLGATFDESFDDVRDALRGITSGSRLPQKEFLRTHNWTVSAAQLYRSYEICS